MTDIPFAPRALEVERKWDGTLYLRSRLPPAPYPTQLSEWLRRWAKERPRQPFLAERVPGGWRTLAYAEALELADRVSQALLDLGLGPERPAASLGPNSIDVAILKLAAMQVGIPFVPVSPSYSLLSEDFGVLRHVFKVARPALVYVSEPQAFRRALQAVESPGLIQVTRVDKLTGAKPGREGRHGIGLLLFLNRAECARALGLDANLSFAELAANGRLREMLRERFAAYNQHHHGGSRRVSRFAIMTEPPSPAAHEITDKGYLNQRAVLASRAAWVEALYAREPAADVIVMDEGL